MHVCSETENELREAFFSSSTLRPGIFTNLTHTKHVTDQQCREKLLLTVMRYNIALLPKK